MSRHIRPAGFIDHSKVIEVIENSIASTEHWKELTGDAFDSTERMESLEELINIVVELTWRYGYNVKFCFTAKKNIPNTIPAKDIAVCDMSEVWAERLFVDETNLANPKVYIKF